MTRSRPRPGAAGTVTGDFTLTMSELRLVTSYVVDTAAPLLPRFEEARPDDDRPRLALEAARVFIDGAPRSKLQRTTSLDAHRAAREAPTEVARLAAQAAGDAASAAYLHPIAKAHQVGHVLRAAANGARIAELEAPDDPAAADRALDGARLAAPDGLLAVLTRYPSPAPGRSRPSVLMHALDAALRGS